MIWSDTYELLSCFWGLKVGTFLFVPPPLGICQKKCFYIFTSPLAGHHLQIV